MKGLQPLFLGIFGIFAFSWLGMTVVPNLQIGSLNPQTDEDGGDVYPAPPSGMVLRGAQVYAANGCVYCHSQQVRPEYGGSDIERKWGERRSAPRDYIFEPIVFLGKMRIGPDLANVGSSAGACKKRKQLRQRSAAGCGAGRRQHRQLPQLRRAPRSPPPPVRHWRPRLRPPLRLPRPSLPVRRDIACRRRSTSGCRATSASPMIAVAG